MNSNIIEAIKTDNLDLFKLLFDYRRILNKVVEKGSEIYYCQLIYETNVSSLYLYPINYKIPKECFISDIVEFIDSIKIQAIFECYNFINNDFKYLFKPSEFLDLCIEYNSINIFIEYINQIY